jgi:hypothetical protein
MEISHEDHLWSPQGKKDSTLKNKGKNFCTHCNMSGHWNDKCWKLHPQLRKKPVKESMQKKVENETIKQETIIQEATNDEAHLSKEKVVKEETTKKTMEHSISIPEPVHEEE